ncbi:MAG: hypothetical protein ACE5J5_05945 [Candidatus Hydrothermarchaeales archaeon]
MVTTCPNCGSELIDKKVLGTHEYNLIKYIEVKLSCNVCGHSEIRKVAKGPVKKLEDEPDIDIKSLVTAAESPVITPKDEITARRKRRSKIFANIKRTLLYVSALFLGIFVEVLGIFLERQMMIMELPAVMGFTVSLIFFILAPILVVSAFIYHFTKKPFEGIFLGALVIPVTIILIYFSRRFQWNYLEQIRQIYDVLLTL